MLNSQVQEQLDYYRSLKEYGIIAEYDFISIQMTLPHLDAPEGMVSFCSYYPEWQMAYLSHDAVSYWYNHGLKYTKFADTLSQFALSFVSFGTSWGISAMNLATGYSGYSQLERAVHQAYWQGKGIRVYYKMHRSIMSLNTVRYAVG